MGLFLFASIVGFAQETEKLTPEKLPVKKNALSFGYLGVGELRDQIWAVPSVAYRRKIGNGHLRSAIGITIKDVFEGQDAHIVQNGLSARLGYQYRILDTRIAPTVGIDLALGMYNQQRSYTDYQEKSESFNAGVSPNLGIEFWISPNVSIATETRIDFLYRESKNSSSFSSQNTSKGFTTRFSPLSLFYISIYL